VSIPIILAVLISVYYIFTLDFFSYDECATIEDPILRKECYAGKAIRGSDPSICDNIGEEEDCEECKEVLEQVLETGGSGGGGGGSSSEDSSGGSEITEEEQEDPFDVCEALPGSEKDWCIRDIAVQEGNPSICLLVDDPYYRDSCYRFIALDTGESSYCDYMEDGKRRKWCHEAFD